jgi:predicted small integral membrane protein
LLVTGSAIIGALCLFAVFGLLAVRASRAPAAHRARIRTYGSFDHGVLAWRLLIAVTVSETLTMSRGGLRRGHGCGGSTVT